MSSGLTYKEPPTLGHDGFTQTEIPLEAALYGPVARARNMAPMEPTSRVRRGQKTILVVDDSPEVLDFVSVVLVDGDYHVLGASNGQEAVQKSKDYEGAIHLLLSDFQMPGMTGVALANQIALERPAIKVLLMSGFAGGGLILNEGWHYLPKPFIPSQLLKLIAGLISPDRSPRS